MIVFDKANVHFMWDDSLVGRHCYFADSMDDLIKAIISQEENIGVVTNFGDVNQPFHIIGSGYYSLVYPIDVMTPSIFSTAYVKFEWDYSLEHKKGFMANTIDELKTKVLNNATPELFRKNESETHPFIDTEDGANRLAYFDPYYSVRYAFFDGESIEYLGGDGIWKPLENCIFNLPPSHYRFKYAAPLDITSTEACNPVYTPVTNMELSRWLAEGHGYVLDTVNGNVITHFQFNYVERNNRFDNNRFLLRNWNSEL